MDEKKPFRNRKRNVLDAGNSLNDKVLCGDRAGLVETADFDASRKWNAERFRTEYCYEEVETRMLNAAHGVLPNFDRATKEPFTANDNSMGSSGGTTLVTINTQSSNSFDFFRFLSIPNVAMSQRNIS